MTTFDNSITTAKERFDEIADIAKDHANEILEAITSGYVPSRDKVQEFSNNVDQLRECYDVILKGAREYLDDSEFPNDATAGALINAIEKKRIDLLERNLADSQLILQKFSLVKSYIESYAVALEPFQKKAESILKDLENGITDIDDSSLVTKGAEQFLNVLAMEDYENQEGQSALESLEEYFPSKVQLGIATRQYYIDESEQSLDNADDLEMPEEPVPSDDAGSMDNADIISSEAKETSVETVSVSETVPEELNDIASAAEETDAHTTSAIPGDEAEQKTPVIMLHSINKVKKSVPSANSFKKDLPKLPVDSFILLPLFTNLGALTELQAFKFGVAMDYFEDDEVEFSSVKNTLKKLSSKSLLTAFDLDGTPVYCLSSYCNGCLKKETIQHNKLFAVSFGKYAIVTDDDIERDVIERVVKYNNNLVCYFYGIKDSLTKDEHKKVQSSISMKDGYYHIDAIYEGEAYSCELFDDCACGKAEDNLLVIGSETPIDSTEEYSNVFLFANGKISRHEAINEGLASDEGQPKTYMLDETINEQELEQNTAEFLPYNNMPAFEEKDRSQEAMSTEGNKETNGETARKCSIEELINAYESPDDSTFCSLVESIASGSFLSNGILNDVPRATLLARAASLDKANEKCSRLAQKLLLATHLPIGDYQYSSEMVSDALSDCEDEYLKLAIYMQSLLTPASSYDFVLNQMAEESFKSFEKEFPSLDVAKQLYNKMIRIHEVLPMGFSPSIMVLLGDDKARKQYAEKLQKQAKDLLNIPNIKTRIKTLPALYNKSFGSGSDLYSCMQCIADNNVEELEWVKVVLKQYCDTKSDELILSSERIDAMLDSSWNEVNPKNHFELDFGARDKALREFNARLLLMKSWVDHIEQTDNGKVDISRISILKKDIANLARSIAQNMNTITEGFVAVLRYALLYINNYLNDPESTNEVFREFIYSGVFSVNENGVPIIDGSTVSIKYYEPWRRVLKHVASPIKTSNQARSAIVDVVDGVKSELFDNLHQLSILSQIEDSAKLSLSESQIKEAKKAAEDRTKNFKEKLELAYTYNRISEPEKERLATIMEEYKPKFFEIMDFGCWSQFLDALEKTINRLADERRKDLRKEIDARKQLLGDNEVSAILDEADDLLENSMNFAVTEEYLNRFDNGERNFSDDLYALIHEEDSFKKFLSDEVFKPLQHECESHSGRTLKSFATKYLETRMPESWTTRNREDSLRLISNWPIKKSATANSSIQNLFSGLGFVVKKVEKGQGKREEFYKLFVEASPKSMADYRHPISLFGTQMKSPINVVVLYGNYAPKQLVDTITGLDFGGMTIVLIDRPIDRASRRQIGEIFHTQTSRHNPFILIDQILIMHLAMYQTTERIPVLLKCTLPYTSYQPFVRDGGSTADEMFFGRSRELSTILDPNGACVVYGGRQLGKTALLQRAESRYSDPSSRVYAVYCNIIDCDSENKLINKVTDDINRKTGLNIEKTSTIGDFCKQLDTMFRTEKIQSMLLLLDEADKFLSSIAESRYNQIQPLIDLKRESMNRFKFVLAGLHNVCRAKNATSENGVFGQLGTPLCVKPLSPTDALQLLSRPLKYLGFDIDRYPHLETILTNTNYYPGILQFFGYSLVEALNNQYSRYYCAVDGNPPFTLQDEQLGAVMNDADLNRSIRDKFRWSLELDARYFMLARCIAVLYFIADEKTENWLGFSAEDIRGIAEEYNIHCLETCDKADYTNLLDEMVEMGILSKPSDGLYRLRRNSFVDIIATVLDALDEDIVSNNAEVA